jgi:hypothetical protein
MLHVPETAEGCLLLSDDDLGIRSIAISEVGHEASVGRLFLSFKADSSALRLRVHMLLPSLYRRKGTTTRVDLKKLSVG